MTTLLVNHWHDDNKGDSAITAAIIELVRLASPTEPISVVSMLGARDGAYARAFRHLEGQFSNVEFQPSLSPTLLTDSTVPTFRDAARWATALIWSAATTVIGRPPTHMRRSIRSADHVILVGGSNLFDSGKKGPFGTLRLLQCVLPALAARRADKPYSLVGHTLGPVNTTLGRRLLRTVVKHARVVVVREEISSEFVRDTLHLDLGSRLVHAPDVAFISHPTPSAGVTAIVEPLRHQRFGVLVPRPYHHQDADRDRRLVDELVVLGREALDSGMVDSIVVFPQCFGPLPIEDDRPIAAAVAASDWRFQLVEADLNHGEICELFADAAFVVSVRLHAAIFALAVGTPVHAVAYFTHKTRGVLTSIGLDEAWSEFDTFSGLDALKLLDAMRADESKLALATGAEQRRASVRKLAAVLV